ncbi:cell surface protein [Lactobacillus nasalidis]|uniref:Cell surface protein n=1 Tax=Lactobacillus nasalidis TaxID=2797258 RepID=A0ABQ3W625_9LACO|nr:L,D-transpeptidase [Lactobacillus nasalidis]GHV97670.1 cell surface protein [Lactobacillus nasalidis]GHV98918.1 cell surface protein [Lactobacillus nasalidis]GHW02011.1 cell surface protein [Lactobacillus nasalidis]
MNKAHKRIGMLLIAIIACLMIIPVFEPLPEAGGKSGERSRPPKKEQVAKKEKTRPYADPSDMRPMTGRYYLYASETQRKYPDLRKYKNVWIRVSILGSRAYVMSGKKVLYTMYASAGAITKKGTSLTPVGNYRIQQEAGEVFYNNNGVGARYYVSYHQHGVYLFHSVPINNFASGVKVGRYYYGYKGGAHLTTLGKKPDSHGCVRLSVSDAKWIYEQRMNGGLPVGSKVVLKMR